MALWKTIDDWDYEYFELDTPSSEFGILEPIVDLWKSKQGNAKIPSWSSFDFYDFVGWHGRVSKTTIISLDPYDWKYDLFGTEFVNLYGRDLTYKHGNEIRGTHHHPEIEDEFYEMIFTNNLISRTSGTFQIQGLEHKYAETVELPLSEDGVNAMGAIEILL